MIFANRAEAGRALADRLAHLLGTDRHPLVLALPRGGLPVAGPVAERLGGDLDIVVARKIGSPRHPEFGVGAIAEDGPPVYDPDNLRYAGVTEAGLADVLAAERAELARRIHRYRGGRPVPSMAGRTVIVIDDGLATGVTAHAALRWVREQGPGRLILAAPVCAPQARDALSAEADEVVCLSAPDPFYAVGRWYEDFEQLTDEDVGHFIMC
ncbi:putative phosphoribosyltransferase [Actinoplanes campanulatus]|uniref:Putative phosphoribosyltransferase n=1 Tax=Actinoplanes campanulatus TaxID=113559 RepID=A0A7W5ANF9_9ACTN|nr:phosphoribosyltransferase [Actinoplanes campanulatus]MBB3099448.1 putative phosphoribosyltransferase [Actinoplanes campanulatus]GGN42798.1 phosphoribosyltransferase [Actinoplanes campanulatus]GID39796.1 phosphoribosyltransferase [Actinoplanes campanulatus]